MKLLTTALFLISASVFAQELDATEALLLTLPQGNYSGQSTNGNPCIVSVRNLPNRIAVIASDGSLTTRSEVYKGAPYRWIPGKREFLASVLTATLTDRRVNFVRMIAVDEKSQYVAVGDIMTSNDAGALEAVVECVINY
jgi:hypothetical protein